MKKITYDIEWSLERFHWWFTGRRKLLKVLISSRKTHSNSPIVDAGCGVGSNLSLLESLGFKAIGVDSHFYCLSLFKKRLSEVSLVNADVMNLPFKSDSISLVVATDILEHLDQDTIGIKEIYRTTKPEGEVIVTVPAFRCLWGVQDVVGMHKRRYSRKEFITKMEQEGFKILRSSYFNFFLFFPILMTRRIIHLMGFKIESENEVNFPIINFIFKAIFSLEVCVLKYLSFPFGVSILCIAKKREL